MNMSVSIYEIGEKALEEMNSAFQGNFTKRETANGVMIEGIGKKYSQEYFFAAYIPDEENIEVAFAYPVNLANKYSFNDFKERFNTKKNEFPYIYIHSNEGPDYILAQVVAKVWDKGYTAGGWATKIIEAFKTLMFHSRAEEAIKKIESLE